MMTNESKLRIITWLEEQQQDLVLVKNVSWWEVYTSTPSERFLAEDLNLFKALEKSKLALEVPPPPPPPSFIKSMDVRAKCGVCGSSQVWKFFKPEGCIQPICSNYYKR